MNQILNLVVFMTARFDAARRDAHDRGATATEYAMLVAFIAVAIAVAVTAFGKNLSAFFTSLSHKIGLN
jgi:pilus assembly protein Flp/PilA